MGKRDLNPLDLVKADIGFPSRVGAVEFSPEDTTLKAGFQGSVAEDDNRIAKAKYKRRWRGPGGKYEYEYDESRSPRPRPSDVPPIDPFKPARTAAQALYPPKKKEPTHEDNMDAVKRMTLTWQGEDEPKARGLSGAAFVDANEEDEDSMEEVAKLKPGESTWVGGGAGVGVKITRTK